MNLPAPQQQSARQPVVLMLLTNAYDPDPRVRQEALALIATGCRVRLLAWDRDRKSPPFEEMEGVEVERVYLTSKHGRGTTQLFFYAILYLQMLWRALRTGFDAVHCHDLDTLPLGFAAGKLKRKPIIYDAHESFSDMLEGSVHPVVRQALVRLEDFLIRRTELLITVGEKLRRHFEHRGSRHSVVVGNWKRLDEFSRTAEEATEVRRRLGIPAEALAVVSIGNLNADRKLDELLDAVEDLPDTYALIGGDGPLRRRIEERANKNPRILYVGFVKGRDIADYTCACDVVYYGFDDRNPNARFSAPNKLFEALAAGRPVITGNFGEIADVVRVHSCGIVISEYSVAEVSGALSALQDMGRRLTLGGNARCAGQTSMNWSHAESILHREYSALLHHRLTKPSPPVNTPEHRLNEAVRA